MSETSQSLRITAHPTTDLQVCIFSLDQPIADETLNCTDPERAKGSPLLESLFALDGVSQVMVSVSSITIAKTGNEPWSDIGKKIGSIIRQEHARGTPLISQEFREKFNGPKLDAGDLKGQIQRVLDTEVNPSVASHGGNIKLEDVRGARLLVTMSGGCKGCSSAQVTLKQGVERIIFSKFPQITEIVDVTDHASGTRPYM